MKRLFIIGMDWAAPVLSLIMCCAPELALADAGAECRTQPIEIIEPDLEGYAPFRGTGAVTLCLQPHSLTATVTLEGLDRLHVYSAWWIYRSQPMDCRNPSHFGWTWTCDGALWETGNEEGETPVVGRLGSTIANLGGKARWRDTLRGFSPPPGSAVIVLIMHHGEAKFDDTPRLARQRLTPERWTWGSPGLGNFFDYYTRPWVFEVGWTQFVFD